jgi:hypothetical protein
MPFSLLSTLAWEFVTGGAGKVYQQRMVSVESECAAAKMGWYLRRFGRRRWRRESGDPATFTCVMAMGPGKARRGR